MPKPPDSEENHFVNLIGKLVKAGWIESSTLKNWDGQNVTFDKIAYTEHGKERLRDLYASIVELEVKTPPMKPQEYQMLVQLALLRRGKL